MNINIKLCDYWKKTLGLSDWDIVIKTKRRWDIGEERQGEVQYSFLGKQALINILDPSDWNNEDFKQDIEKTLVHELLHCKFAILESETGEIGYYAHQLLNDIAKSFVKCRKGNENGDEV